MKHNKRAVSGIALVLLVNYGLIVLVLCVGKILELNLGNVVKIIIPFVFLSICVVLLLSGKFSKCKDVVKNPEFSSFLKQAISDLKSLGDGLFDVGDGTGVSSESVSNSHAQVESGGPIFFFPEFKSYFDSLLNKAINCGVFSGSNGTILVSDDRLKEKLSKEDILLMTLTAQLIINNPMLSVTYSKSMIIFITRLSSLFQISVEDYSKIECENAIKKIEKLLSERVYVSDNWKQLSSKLSKSLNVIFEDNKILLYKTDVLYDGDVDCSEKEKILRGLLKIANLKYYFVSDLDEAEAMSTSIKTVDDIIENCKKEDIGIAAIIAKLNEEKFDVVDIEGKSVIKIENGCSVAVAQPNILHQLKAKLEKIICYKNKVLKRIEDYKCEILNSERYFYEKLKAQRHVINNLLRENVVIDLDLKILLQDLRSLNKDYCDSWEKSSRRFIENVEEDVKYVTDRSYGFSKQCYAQLKTTSLIDQKLDVPVLDMKGICDELAILVVSLERKKGCTQNVDQVRKCIAYFNKVNLHSNTLKTLYKSQRANVLELSDCILKEQAVRAKMQEMCYVPTDVCVQHANKCILM